VPAWSIACHEWDSCWIGRGLQIGSAPPGNLDGWATGDRDEMPQVGIAVVAIVSWRCYRK
jgi:hypothetical protein